MANQSFHVFCALSLVNDDAHCASVFEIGPRVEDVRVNENTFMQTVRGDRVRYLVDGVLVVGIFEEGDSALTPRQVAVMEAPGWVSEVIDKCHADMGTSAQYTSYIRGAARKLAAAAVQAIGRGAATPLSI